MLPLLVQGRDTVVLTAATEPLEKYDIPLYRRKDGSFVLICEMPLKYIAEMFCDRVGASKAYLGKKYTDDAPLKYAEGKAEREKKLMAPRVYDKIHEWLSDLAEHGEEFVCKKIRNELRG